MNQVRERKFHSVFALSGIGILAAIAAATMLSMPAHADAVDDWYQAVCGDNGKVFRWLAYSLSGVVGLRLVTDFKAVQQIPLIGPLLSAVSANWPAILSALSSGTKNAAPPAAKGVLLIGMLSLLESCAGGLPSPAQIQADQQKALYYLAAAGCFNAAIVNTLSPIAAPIVAANVGPGGNIVLSLVDATANAVATAQNGGQPCTVTVPAAAVTPAPASAAPPK